MSEIGTAPGHVPRALFVGLGLLTTATGLFTVLVSTRAESEGFGAVAIGLMSASYFLGYGAAARMTGRLVIRDGHRSAFAVAAALASATALVHGLAVNAVAWVLLRAVGGWCVGVITVIVESWLISTGGAKTARLTAIYLVVMSATFAVGATLVGIAPTDGLELFAVAAVLYSLSSLPVLVSITSPPPVDRATPFGLLKLTRRTPLGVAAAFSGGATWGAIAGLAVVAAFRLGFDASTGAQFAVAAVVGGPPAQLFVSHLANRFDHRRLIAVLASSVVVVAGSALAAPPSGTAHLLAVGVALGATTGPLYAMAITHTSTHLGPEEMFGASSSLVLASSIGLVTGPLLGGPLTRLLGASGWFWTLTIVAMPALVTALDRLVRGKRATPPDAIGVIAPARASPGAGRIAVSRIRRAKIRRRRRANVVQ